MIKNMAVLVLLTAGGAAAEPVSPDLSSEVQKTTEWVQNNAPERVPTLLVSFKLAETEKVTVQSGKDEIVQTAADKTITLSWGPSSGKQNGLLVEGKLEMKISEAGDDFILDCEKFTIRISLAKSRMVSHDYRYSKFFKSKAFTRVVWANLDETPNSIRISLK